MNKACAARKLRRAKLSAQQERFVDEYLKDLDAVEAFKRAGYKSVSRLSTERRTWDLLHNIDVIFAIQQKRAAIEQRTRISQDRVRVELGRIAFLDPRNLFDEAGHFIDITKLPAEVAAAISSISISKRGDRDETITRIRLCSKVEALDKLCRHLGMYEDKLRIGGLERELAEMSDEDLEREIIELRRQDWKSVGSSASGSRALTRATETT